MFFSYTLQLPVLTHCRIQVINQRAALLCNYEVLTLLRTLESDHIAKTRTALRIKKEEEAAGVPSTRQHMAPEEVLENLRTVEVEVSTFPRLWVRDRDQ